MIVLFYATILAAAILWRLITAPLRIVIIYLRWRSYKRTIFGEAVQMSKRNDTYYGVSFLQDSPKTFLEYIANG